MSNATANANAINAQLYRKIKSGKKFENLMPQSDCSSVKLAIGDTKVAIDNMALWSKRYQRHTKKLAVTFANKGLKRTCIDLHKFLYDHFQYKIDGLKQNLRSPACSWSTRDEGIDCKSYSIFASTVLSNLGIHHYFRRIKVAADKGYSHVYVIVPINQDTPTNLKDGYYTIDGTLKEDSEPIFYEKDDVFMKAEAELPIYGLAGVSLGNPVNGSLMKGASQIIDLAFQGLFNELLGCDDAIYDINVVKLRLQRDLKGVLQSKLNDLDEAILTSNRSRIMHLFNDIFKELDLGIAHLRNETAYSGKDQCIIETLTIGLKYTVKIKQVFDTFFNNFKQSFKLYEIEEFTKSESTSKRTMYFIVENDTNPITSDFRYIVLRKKDSKYGIEPIFPFEQNSNTWLAENVRHLKTTYNDGREKDYTREIQPILNKIIELRKRVHLGGESLYYFEKPIQEKAYKIWLKYDTKYTDFLEAEARSFRTANELAMKDYQNRFKKEIELDRKARNRKDIKQSLGYLALAFSGFLLVNKK